MPLSWGRRCGAVRHAKEVPQVTMDIQTDSKGNPILDQHSEEGFVDLTFRIGSLSDDGEHYRFHLTASHKKRTVGMDVVLVKGIQGGFNAKMNLVKKHVYRLGVRFL